MLLYPDGARSDLVLSEEPDPEDMPNRRAKYLTFAELEASMRAKGAEEVRAPDGRGMRAYTDAVQCGRRWT